MKLLEDIVWVTAKIWKVRRLWVLFAVLSGLAVVYSASNAGAPRNGPGLSTWPNISLSLSIAIFSAALIEIFSQINGLTEMRRKQRELRDLFGFEDSGKSVAIVLSRFDVDATQIWRQQVMKLPDSAKWDSMPSPSQDNIGIAVQTDIVAASDLLGLFSSLGFHAPALIWDDRAVEEYENDLSQFRTFITLGIASNSLSMLINRAGTVQRTFKLDMDSDWDGKPTDRAALWLLKLAPYERKTLDFNEDNWDTFRFNKQIADYGLISRVEARGRTVFLLAGINADGTERLSKFVSSNWASILEWRDEESKHTVKNRCFAAVVDFPADANKPVGGGRQVRVPVYAR